MWQFGRRRGCGVVCVVGSVLLAGCAATQQAPQRETYRVYRATGPITIDGTFDEPSWRGVPVVNGFFHHGRGDLTEWPPAQRDTRFRLLWDDRYLYCAFEMDDWDVYATYKKQDDYLWEGDVIEWFVKPSPDAYMYWELQTNPLGTVFDQRIARRGSGGKRYIPFDAKMRAAARVMGTLNNWRDKDTGWVAEVAIPWACFDQAKPSCPPKPGDTWKLNVSRYNYSVYLDQYELSSWSKLGKCNYHWHEDYNRVVFIKQAPPVATRPATQPSGQAK